MKRCRLAVLLIVSAAVLWIIGRHDSAFPVTSSGSGRTKPVASPWESSASEDPFPGRAPKLAVRPEFTLADSLPPGAVVIRDPADSEGLQVILPDGHTIRAVLARALEGGTRFEGPIEMTDPSGKTQLNTPSGGTLFLSKDGGRLEWSQGVIFQLRDPRS